MKITNTRKTEKVIIEIYKCSKKKGLDTKSKKAESVISIIRKCFQLIGIFTKDDHAKNVEQLYFSERNILTVGLERMADKMYLHKNTLYSYRKKYCLVIDAILSFIKETDFFDFYHAA